MKNKNAHLNLNGKYSYMQCVCIYITYMFNTKLLSKVISKRGYMYLFMGICIRFYIFVKEYNQEK